MKKFLLAAIFLSVFTAAASAKEVTAVGLYGNVIGSGTGMGGPGLGITLKFGNFPVLGIEYAIAAKALSLGASCDYWVINQHLTGALDYYLGLGGYLSYDGGNRDNTINFGGRIPIGLQIYPVDKFEIFGEFAPLVLFLPSPNINFSIRIGLRVHL